MHTTTPSLSTRLAAIVALLIAVATSRAARAQVPADARAEYTRGTEAFAARQFRPALQAFQHAFEITGDSAILFNIGVTWERLGEAGEAARALRRFLVAVPNAPNRADVEERIAALEATDRQISGPAAAAPARAETVVTPVAPIPIVVQPAVAIAHRTRIWPWAVAGAGVAIAIAGGIALAFDSPDYLADHTEQMRVDHASAANTQAIVGGTMLGVGFAVAAAAVLTQLFLGGSDHAERTARIDVVPLPSGGAVTLGGALPWL